VPLKKGDTVKVMRGSFAGKEGAITDVERASGRVFIEKIVRKKSDGSEVRVGIDASNLLVTGMERTDRKRLKERTKGKK